MHVQPPSALAASYVQELLRHLPAVRNGDVDGVHQARVATRRLREVAPLLVPSRGGQAEEWGRLARRAGRQLGRVRELDVMDESLSTQEARVPAVAAVAAVARQTLVPRRQRARRRLIKALERLDVERLAEVLPMTPSRWEGMRERYAPGPWAAMLRERLGKRADALRGAVNHATGVYFPNRAHRTRVAVKKLRYAVEIAQATGMWRPRHVLQDLKRAQATLGRLHDLQVLSDGLSELVDEDGVRKDASVLSSAVKGEAEAEFATYLGDRDRLLAICDVVRAVCLVWPTRNSRSIPSACRRVGSRRPSGIPAAQFRQGTSVVASRYSHSEQRLAARRWSQSGSRRRCNAFPSKAVKRGG